MEKIFLKKDKKTSWVKKVKLWWNFEGRYIISNFRNGVSNLIKWFPVIWKDRNYDHAFIYDILSFKLKRQADYLLLKNRSENTEQKVRNIRIAIKLIDRIKNDFYRMEYSDYLEEDFWFEKATIPGDEQEFFSMHSEIKSEELDNYIGKYTRIHRRVMAGETFFPLSGARAELKKSIAMNIAHINSIRAHNLLFKILRDDIENWWD